MKIPPTLPRFVPVESAPPGARWFVLLEDLIAHHLDALFPGMEVRETYLFRVTRDADLDLQEDEADDLLEAIESELQRRRFGEPVRIEVERGIPEYMRDLLLEALELSETDCYEVDGFMALRDLWSVIGLPDYEKLRDAPFTPAIPKRLIGVTDMFAAIRDGDIVLHHPYESFDPVVQFVQQASQDERVLAIMTSRTSEQNSPIVRALRSGRTSRSPSSSSSRRASTKRTTSVGSPPGRSARGLQPPTSRPTQGSHQVVLQDDDGRAACIRHRQLQWEKYPALPTELVHVPANSAPMRPAVQRADRLLEGDRLRGLLVAGDHAASWPP